LPALGSIPPDRQPDNSPSVSRPTLCSRASHPTHRLSPSPRTARRPASKSRTSDGRSRSASGHGKRIADTAVPSFGA